MVRPLSLDQIMSSTTRTLLASSNRPLAIHGGGGFGKTTLAIAVCHDPEVIRTFPNGILWVTMGEKNPEVEREPLGGGLNVFSGASLELPQFIVKDHAELGRNLVVSVSQEVVIEEYARVSYDCRISDNDGHPREADLRAATKPVHLRDIRPVRVGRYAWVGSGMHIMKGVTIGEGAILGTNSAVITDIPYWLALGNPAEVYFRNVGPRRSADSVVRSFSESDICGPLLWAETACALVP